VAFANANDGWAVGDDGVFDTTDAVPLEPAAVGRQRYGRHLRQCHDVWLVAGSNIVASANGGATWISQYSFRPMTSPQGDRLRRLEPSVAVGGSPDLGGGTILATTDGGWPTPTGLGVSP